MITGAVILLVGIFIGYGLAPNIEYDKELIKRVLKNKKAKIVETEDPLDQVQI